MNIVAISGSICYHTHTAHKCSHRIFVQRSIARAFGTSNVRAQTQAWQLNSQRLSTLDLEYSRRGDANFYVIKIIFYILVSIETHQFLFDVLPPHFHGHVGACVTGANDPHIRLVICFDYSSFINLNRSHLAYAIVCQAPAANALFAIYALFTCFHVAIRTRCICTRIAASLAQDPHLTTLPIAVGALTCVKDTDKFCPLFAWHGRSFEW